VFTPLVFLGQTTPGGQQFLDVFDSSRLNNRSDVLFGSNMTADDAGGLFVLRRGEISQIPASVGEPAPGGGTFSLGTLLPMPSTIGVRRVSSGCSTPSVFSIPKNVPSA
jgi:hypothetical protein